jgi:hypothetical protein
MGRRPALAGALAAPLLLLTLTACGSDTSVADPPVSPPPTSSAPPTPPKRESPEHFIRRWAEVEKKMENTGQTHTYLAMSRGCVACRKLARLVEGYYEAGGFLKWGGWRILSIQVHGRTPHTTTFAVRNRSLPTAYKESAGGELSHFSGGVTVQLLRLSRSADSWIVRGKAELAS